MQSLDGEVHLYRLNLAECPEALFDRAGQLLNTEERERAGRFRHEPSKRAFVLVRSALRVLLGRYLYRDPASLSFITNDKGKPRLAGTAPDQGLVFNVSHSGDWGLLAFSLNTALGVDVERKRTMAYREGMAERCFANAELAWWHALPEQQREAAFFGLWCCKEAFVKATGEGITLGLEACVVDLSGPARLLSVPAGCGMADEWRLSAIDMGEDYSAAVCYHGANRKLHTDDAAVRVDTVLKVADWLESR